MRQRVIRVLKVAMLAGLISCLFPMVLLATDWPKDPPVDTGGEGENGNDWLDFEYGTLTVNYIRNSTSFTASTVAVRIEADNPNFDDSHCRTSAETDHNVRHLHVQLDLGDNFGGGHGTITAAECKAYWDDAYYGYHDKLGATYYLPVSGGYNPTTSYNCMAHVLHNYNSELTKATSWVNPEDAQQYFNELTLVSAQSDHSVLVGDRLRSTGPSHAWKVMGAGVNDKALDIEWKNGESGIYRWDHLPLCSNDCPEGNVGTSLLSAVGIYRKTE